MESPEIDWALLASAGGSLARLILVVVVGIAASSALRRAVRWLVTKTRLDVLAETVGVPRILYAVGIKAPVSDVLGDVAWYTGLLVTVNVVASLLGLSGVADGVAVLVAWLPALFSGVVIAFAGVYAGQLVQGLVSRAAAGRGDTETATMLGQGAYFLVIAIALTRQRSRSGSRPTWSTPSC